MATFRVATQLAIDKASAQGAKVAMEGVTKAATQLAGALVGEKIFLAPIKGMKALADEAIAASEKASAAQERIRQSLRNTFAAIGDEMAPGLQQLGESIQKALANPEVVKGLQATGQYLDVMVMGISAVVDEVSSFVGSPAFAGWIQFVSGIDLNSKNMQAYREHSQRVQEIVGAVYKWAKSVDEQRKEEEKAAQARKKAHDEHLKNLQAILDRVNPIAAAERETWQQIQTLNQALKAGEVDVKTYQSALAFLTAELNAVKASADLVAERIETMPVGDRTVYNPFANVPASTQEASFTISQDSYTAFEREMDEITEGIVANLESGMTAAFASSLLELMHGSDDWLEHLGQSLTELLLQAAAQWAAEMLAGALRAAAVSGAAGGGGGGGASGLTGAAGAGSKAWSFMSGGSAGASVAWAAVAVAAVLAISNAVRKHADAVKYGTSVLVDSINSVNGAIGTSVRGGKQQTGGAIAEGVRNLLLALQQSTGALVTALPEIEIKVRNDGKLFNAYIAGLYIGQFKDATEAIKAAALAAFKQADFATALAPEIQSVIQGFQGNDPEKLIEAITTVRNVLDEVAGLSEIEITIRDLDGSAAGLMNQLIGLGVAMNQAERIAEQWKVTQLQSLRDQITGHQQTEAEQRAEFERQRAMFNAKLALEKLDIQSRIDALDAKIAIVQAGGQLLSNDIIVQSNYLQTKADLYGQSWNLDQINLENMAAANNVSIEILNAMRENLNAALAALEQIDPIGAGEFHPRGTGSHGGGHSAPTGPTDAERAAAQLAADIKAFLEDVAATWRSLTKGVGQRIAELDYWYEQQAARARELGQSLEEINEQYEQQLLNLQNDTLASLGLQSVETINRFNELIDALKHLTAWGTITEEQLRELGDSLFLSLADGLMQYVDNEEVKRALEDLRFQLEMHNYELQFQMIIGLGLLTEAQIATIQGLLDTIWEDYANGDLPFQQLPNVNQTQSNNTAQSAREAAEQALRSALDRLANAIDSLNEYYRGMELSAVSPLTTSQQYQVAAQQYAQILAAAQGGDLAAIEQLAGAAQTYLELAAQMFGTSGAGYGAIFDAVQQQIAGIIAAGQGVLGAVPPMQGTEQRLDTIAQILNQIRILYGGAPQWNPTGPPIPGAAGTPTVGNFGGNAGVVSVRSPEITAQLAQLTAAHEAATREAKRDRMKKQAGTAYVAIGGKRSA